VIKGRHIVLGITGSIAAYKAAYLTRLLKKAGADVKIIITPTGKEFITPVTLATLSCNTVLCDMFSHDDGAWNSHIELGMWADLFLVAPASANTIAKMANGICDNLLLTSYLSARCPVMVAPAMDCDMYAHTATRNNIETLLSRAHLIIEPDEGELASGLSGKGRMAEPERIVKEVEVFFKNREDLSGKKILVTAGPTFEAIDPVRFIGNHSSGKMGYAIASELASRGAEVQLISGPVSLQLSHPAVHITRVTSAAEMRNECKKVFRQCHAAVFAAAVADYTPAAVKNSKISGKKEMDLHLIPTTDIAAELGKSKSKKQVVAGFALESGKGTENAVRKLKEKNLDMIVLNSMSDKGAGFGFDTNKITIIFKDNKKKNFGLLPKNIVAKDIVNELVEIIRHR
jgi:phosphopantothenoylcysteine decarboxylase/phosphopantothenate--cysteine ligase